MEGSKFYPMTFNFGGNTRQQHDDDGNSDLMMEVSPVDQMVSDDDNEPLQLVSDEESLTTQENLDTVVDIYERNYRMEEIKNSNTILDSKFMQVLDQSISDSHIVLAKRFEKICERKVQELQEIYQKTYFLPDEQHLKVGEEFTTLKLEKFTWELLYLLFEDEKKSIENISDHLNQQELKKFVWRVSHREVVNQMMKNLSFRKLHIIVNWLEENAKEKVDVENEGVWLYTSRGGENVDPDSIYKNNNLDENDLRQERIIIKKAWALVRSGQIEEAQKFCRMHNQFWRASTLSGSELYHNPRLMPGSHENEETVGNQNRFVYLNTILSILNSDIVNDDEIHQYERAIYGSIVGDLKSILPCCTSWEDYLWAYCKSTMLYLINQKLSEYVPYDSEDKLYVGSVLDSLKINDRSLLEIVHSVNTSSNDKIKTDAVQYHHVVQSYIICNEMTNLVQYLLDSVLNPAEYSMSYLSNLSRFSTHFVLTWSLTSDDSFRKDERKDAIIFKYIHYLITSKQYESIAFYTKFIHNRNDTNVTYDYRSSLYAESIISIEKFEKESAKNFRSMLIAKAKEQGLNIQEIATIVAQKTLEQKASKDEISNIFDAAFFLDPKNNPLKNLRERQTSELDIKKINSIDWLCIEDINPFNCLLQTNLLIREFIDQGKLGSFELLMKKLHEQIDSKIDSVGLDTKQEVIFKEYMFWTLYEKAITTYVAWNTHIKERPIFSAKEEHFRTQVDKIKYQNDLSQFNNTILKKWTQDNEVFLKQAKDNHIAIIQSPWLTIENVDDATKHEFAKLKQKCIPDIVFCLYQILSFAEEYDACMQLADMVAADSNGLYKYFSQKQLVDFLKLMGVCELLFIDKQQKEGNEVN